MWTISTLENGIKVRDIAVDTGRGGNALTVVQLTDMHVVWMNESDSEDALLAETYASRRWAHVDDTSEKTDHMDISRKCLDTFAEAARIVITGDICDFMTKETLKQVKARIFDVYPNVIACIGNHEVVKKMGAENEYSDWKSAVDVRIPQIQKFWANDVCYHSEVIDERLMLILLDNATVGEFRDEQTEPFKADIARAREEGYAVLLFYHNPISTGNPEHICVQTLDRGDVAHKNFYNSYGDTVSERSTGASKAIYDMIVTNGDIIKGAFCGHLHSDFYMEIEATAADGTRVLIPQYVLKGSIYDKGNALRITVR